MFSMNHSLSGSCGYFDNPCFSDADSMLTHAPVRPSSYLHSFNIEVW